jgi:hypothetical protein
MSATTSSRMFYSVVAADADVSVIVPTTSWAGFLDVDITGPARDTVLQAYITHEKARELRDALTAALEQVSS